ncbi:MAG: hypothetical protein GY795_36295 [Desulfobacterales bacterium]|nr:hypothetical protein [Desulfobacterales bacterium]
MTSKIIQQFEKQLNTTFKKVEIAEIGENTWKSLTEYSINESGSISALCIAKYSFKKKILPILTKVETLSKLILWDIRISDVSSLNVLKNLTELNLIYAKNLNISTLKKYYCDIIYETEH